jgi:hypothetical protein
MLFFHRKLKFICPACGIVSKLDRSFVVENEQKLSPGPGQPPEVECHWCHEGLMLPIRYRFGNGETFQLTHEQLRALRARSNDNEL